MGIPANVEGRELGTDGEARVAETDMAASSREGQRVEPDDGEVLHDEGAPSSGEGRMTEPSGRGPDREPPVRRTYRDQGDNPEILTTGAILT